MAATTGDAPKWSVRDALSSTTLPPLTRNPGAQGAVHLHRVSETPSLRDSGGLVFNRGTALCLAADLLSSGPRIPVY